MNKPKIVIFGLGINFFNTYNTLVENYNIVALTDNNALVRERESLRQVTIIEPSNITKIDFDFVFITVMSSDIISQIKQQLMDLGVEENKIRSMVLDEIDARIRFSGKKILEIGCGNGELLKLIASQFDIKHIIGIDPGLDSWWGGVESKQGSNWHIQDGDAMNLDFEDNIFDAIVSNSAFEHIPDIPKTLEEIKRVLKPGGRFFTEFGAIWTASSGHHWSKPKDNGYFWNPEYMKLIPPWGHLYMDENQMREHVVKLGGDDVIDEMIQFIYHSSIINRHPRKYYISSIMNCGMIIKEFSEKINFSRFVYSGESKSELTNELQKKVENAGYDVDDMGVYGMVICLEKYMRV